MRDAARKIMGDVPIAYVEGAGGVRVAEDETVEGGKNDVSTGIRSLPFPETDNFQILSFKVGRA